MFLIKQSNGDTSALSSDLKLAETALQALKEAHPQHNPHLQSLETAFITMTNKLKEVSKLQTKPTAEVKGHRVFNRVSASSKVDSTKVGISYRCAVRSGVPVLNCLNLHLAGNVCYHSCVYTCTDNAHWVGVRLSCECGVIVGNSTCQ